MSNPYEVYKKQRAASWTRVDMVVALYDEAIKKLDHAIVQIENGDDAEAKRSCLRVVQVVACLRSGVDSEAGSLPSDILRLYHFVDRCVTSGQPQDLEAARNVLVPIRDSFLEIRDSAAELEQEGKIPPLQLDRTRSRTV